MIAAIPRKKRLESIAILSFIVLGASYVLMLAVDQSASHIYSSGFFNILMSLAIPYADKKFLTPKNAGDEDDTNPTAPPAAVAAAQTKSGRNIPVVLQFIGLIFLILYGDNLFFDAFQYSLDSLHLTEERYLTFLLIFGGYVFFISILPLSALGAIIIGLGKAKVSFRQAFVATAFTFGFFFISSALRWTDMNAFPIIPILHALFQGDIQPTLPPTSKIFVFFLTIMIDVVIIAVVSSWLALWGKFGHWRFKKSLAAL